MIPGEIFALNTKRQIQSKYTADVNQYIGWMEDRLESYDITLDELLNRLSRQYNVEIDLQTPTLSNIRLRFSLLNNERIEEAMNVLKGILPINVELSDNKYIIKQKSI